MNSVFIFDINKLNLDRLARPIVEGLNKNDIKCKLFFPQNKFIKPNLASLLQYFKDLEYITKELKKHKLVVIFGYRFWDFFVCSVAKKYSIPVYYVQHGIYSPSISRINKSLLRFSDPLLKVISLIITLIKSSSNLQNKFNLISFYFFNIATSKLSHKKIFEIEKGFLYGTYWIEFHNNFPGMYFKNSYICSYPDILTQPVTDESYEYCFICQTYVEDGRLSKQDYLKFLDSLFQKININQKAKVAIKLHPRSDMSLYSKFNDFKFFKYGSIPKSRIYLSGWSTLVFACSLYGNIYLVSPNEDEIPEFLFKFFPKISIKQLNNKESLNLNFVHNKNINFSSYLNTKSETQFQIIIREIQNYFITQKH